MTLVHILNFRLSRLDLGKSWEKRILLVFGVNIRIYKLVMFAKFSNKRIENFPLNRI